jgi:O-antigen ligase
MTHVIPAPPALVVILPMGGLVVLIAAAGYLGIHADPLVIVAISVFGMVALALAIRHPAALVTPVLFIPRLKEVSVLTGLGPAGHWTALQVTGGLLVAAILLRWLLTSPRRHDRSHQTSAASSDLGKGDPRLGTMAFLLFAAMVAFSYIYTTSPSYGAEKLLGFLTLGGGLFFLSFLVCASETDMRDLIIGTALFGMAVAASSLSFSATGAQAPGDNPSHIGKGQVIGLAILLLVYSKFANRWLRVLVIWVCIPCLALGLVSSETRGPLFSILIVLGMSFFVPGMRSSLMVSRRTMFVVAAVLVGAVGLLSAHWFYGAEAAKFRFKANEIAALVQGSGEAQGTAVQRLGYYGAALDAWIQRPLMGWGVGGWSMVYWHIDDRQYPHNLFLEVLVEQGLAGLGILLFFLAIVLRNLRATWAVTTRRFPWLLPCGIYLLGISMVSGDLDDDRFVWFWCGLMLDACALAHRISGELAPTEKVYGTSGYAPELSAVEPPFLSE